MTDPSTTSHAAILTTCLHAFFASDFDTFMSMYRQDAVHSFPFAPEGMPRRIEGKRDIAEWMRHVPDLVRFDGTVNDLRISSGRTTVTAEWSSTGVFANGKPAVMSYVAVVTFDGDLVVDYRDYMNPLQLQPAFSA